MKILYYGVFDGKTWRSEYPMRQGLEHFGHTIIPINFRSHIPGHGLRSWHKHKQDCDMVFLQNGNVFKPKWLKYIELPLVFKATEFAVTSCQHILDAERPPDMVLAHSQQVVDYCEKKNILVQRVHHAFHHQYYKRIESNYLYDICFIGSLNKRRREWLEPLKKKFGKRIFIGEIWKPEKINQLYNASKITLHIHADQQDYVPTRLFEVLPTQSCLVTESLGENKTSDLSFDGYVEFNSQENMLSNIEDLLNNESKRLAYLKSAWAQAPQHSWQGRMSTYSQFFEETVKRNAHPHATNHSL